MLYVCTKYYFLLFKSNLTKHFQITQQEQEIKKYSTDFTWVKKKKDIKYTNTFYFEQQYITIRIYNVI